MPVQPETAPSDTPLVAPHVGTDPELLVDPPVLGLTESERRAPRHWRPKQVLITAAAREWAHGRAVAERAAALGAEVVELPGNRITGLSGGDAREVYVRSKSTLAVVVSPPGKRRLSPIPPSADWRVDLAEGCPAHCQYCYLAGSLGGPPVTRVYANLPEILDGLPPYLGQGTITSASAARVEEGTTFEASCYTDPLGIEHLSGSLSEAITWFGRWEAPVQLRFTTKYDDVDHLLTLDHQGRTRVRLSLNCEAITRRFEGGTAALPERLTALRRLALAGYPVGLTLAPLMPVPDWREEYARLLAGCAAAVRDVPGLDLTVECITHRFTPGSRDVLMEWYPRTKLEMDTEQRSAKRNKFGGVKYVYKPEQMRELRTWFDAELSATLPAARVLYWT